MSLIEYCRQKLTIEVLNELNKRDRYRVLIVDRVASEQFRRCLAIHDFVIDGGFAIEENVDDPHRQAIPELEAVYVVAPSQHVIKRLLRDFKSGSQLYRRANIFFTEAIPDVYLSMMATDISFINCVSILKEINASFVPIESRVFHLSRPEAFNTLFLTATENDRQSLLVRCADQLATVCSTLSDYPIVKYYMSGNPAVRNLNKQFASLLQARIDNYKLQDENYNDNSWHQQSILLVADRSFDLTSPLVHQTTYQSLIYDVLDVENDEYTFTDQNGQKVGRLSENDSFYGRERHSELNTVVKRLKAAIDELYKSHPSKQDDLANLAESDISARGLANLIKRLPKYQKQSEMYALHAQICSDIKEKRHQFDPLVAAERAIFTGYNEHGERVKNVVSQILLPILNAQFSAEDKLRLILIYVLHEVPGSISITSEVLRTMFNAAHTTESDRYVVQRLLQLHIAKGHNRENSLKGMATALMKTGESTKWVPLIKNIMENHSGPNNVLDSGMFATVQTNVASSLPPTHGSPVRNPRVVRPTQSQASTYGSRGRLLSDLNGPRLIVFVLGGLTYSEMTCAYERLEQTTASDVKTNRYDLMIGSTHILTPKMFIQHLREDVHETLLPAAKE